MSDNMKKLCEIVKKNSGKDISQSDKDSDLVIELGLDSLAVLKLLAHIEKGFDVNFPNEKLSGLRTINSLLSFIETLQKGN